MNQQFSLRWNNYPSQVTDAFSSLRYEEDLVDVTLSCEGKKLKAHKMLLSACSSYFRNVFKENPCHHPVIVFQNVKYTDLEAIIDFMYKGEVSVLQEQLESFLGTAELLEVKGLSDGPGKENTMEEEENANLQNHQKSPSPEPINEANKSTTSKIQSPVSFIPSRTASPPLKRKKYSAPSKQVGKSTRGNLTSLKSEELNIPVVPNTIKEEYIEDLTFDDEEEVDTNTDILTNISQSNIAVDCNTNAEPSDSNLEGSDMGQNLLGHMSSPVDSIPQESMQGGNAENISRNSNNLPFGCNVCGAGYKYERNLNAHMKCHTGETSCPVCSKMLSCKAAFRRHLIMIHGILPETQQ